MRINFTMRLNTIITEVSKGMQIFYPILLSCNIPFAFYDKNRTRQEYFTRFAIGRQRDEVQRGVLSNYYTRDG